MRFLIFTWILVLGLLEIHSTLARDQWEILVDVWTYNVWGLPEPLADNPNRRAAEICRQLVAGPSPDVLLVQEAWYPSIRKIFKTKCGFPHVLDLDRRFRAGWFDSGLLILSKYPILESRRLTYLENGSPWAVDGEFETQKGAIAALVEFPDSLKIWVANTHLVARYSATDDGYLSQRTQQAATFFSWATRISGHLPLILGGDLNFDPTRDADSQETWRTLIAALPEIEGPDQSDPTAETYPGEGKIDHLFGNSLARQVSGDVYCRDSPLSDHFAWRSLFEVSHEHSECDL
ncbi:MAG: endonuclease/exonuclease/phosphatase family protein [Bdellovibrionota bacterium]